MKTRRTSIATLEKQVAKAAIAVGVAEMVCRYADEALGSANINVYMMSMCMKKAQAELNFAKVYLIKAKKAADKKTR